MNPAIEIRDAVPGDRERLVDYACRMAWETEHKRLDPGIVAQGVASLLAHPQRGRYFIAERAGTAVGTAMLTYEWSDWRAADWWWLQSVYVIPEARRSGVFRALHEHIARAATAAPQVCGLRLYVEHDNRAAQATYAALGMRDAGYRMLEQPLQASVTTDH